MNEWPLFGRAAELAHLSETLSIRPYRGVVLAGPPGVGKTRLALECQAYAKRQGFATARITATRWAQSLPLGALAGLLPAVEDLGIGAVDERADMLRRAAAAVVRRAGDMPLALVVDDAHWLDGASAMLIHHLAAERLAFVLATVRTGEPTPDAVTSLWKDDLAERIDIRELTSPWAEELLVAALGGAVDPSAAAQLASRSQGNVLFLRELVLSGLEDGTLCETDGLWRLTETVRPSARLVELIEARLGAVEENERLVLETTALGEPIGTAELDAIGGRAASESLERKHLVTGAFNGRRLELRLAHPLYGDVVRASTPTLRERTLTGTLAETVEGCGARRRDDILRVGTWRLTSGGAQPELMLDAAKAARWRYDFRLAERLARAAVDAGAGFDAALLAAELANLDGRSHDAERELALLARQASDDEQRARVALTRFNHLMMSVGWLDEALRVLDEAIVTISTPRWRRILAMRRLGSQITQPGPRAMLEAAEPLLRDAEGDVDPLSCGIWSWAFGRAGRVSDALVAAERASEARRRLGPSMPWHLELHRVTPGLALAQAGHLADAHATFSSLHREAVSDRSSEAQALFAFGLGIVAIQTGRVETAATRLREAAAIERRLERWTVVGAAMVALALALGLRGRGEAATEVLAELDALGLESHRMYGVDVTNARGWAAVAKGNLVAARDLFTEAADVGRAEGDLVGASAALHALARLGHYKEASAPLSAVAGRMEGDLAPTQAAHALALTERDVHGLEQVVEQFATIGANLLAAEAAADAAVAWRAAGNQRRAAAAEHRASVLAAMCEGATTPALRAVGARAMLTPAEFQTALLASAGRSNRGIAEELVLSIRTVENRLQRVYEKLGVSGRDELASVLEEPAQGAVTGE